MSHASRRGGFQGSPPLRLGKPSPGCPAMRRQFARASLGIAFASFFDSLQIFVDFWIVQKSYIKQRIRGLPKTTQISTIPPNDAQCVNFHRFFMTFGRPFFIEFRDPAKPLKNATSIMRKPLFYLFMPLVLASKIYQILMFFLETFLVIVFSDVVLILYEITPFWHPFEI